MHLFFSTPIWINEISNHESINTELENYIYNQREKNPKGTKKSNVNGWHSEEFDLKNENLKNFISEFSKKVFPFSSGLAIFRLKGETLAIFLGNKSLISLNLPLLCVPIKILFILDINT